MKLLVFNPGSGSLKFQAIEADPGVEAWGRKILQGTIEPVGENASFTAVDASGNTVIDQKPAVPDYAAAAKLILTEVEPYVPNLDLIACRVVHGADRFRKPVEALPEVIREIEALDDLAPLHNKNSVAIIQACENRAPVFAVFDSAFHWTLPEVAYRYAIPFELSERHHIRRYGFHGISHKYLLLRYAELKGLEPEDVNIVTLHLEGGSSAAAIKNGRSVDTSMGFTPLEGLVMATRSGDLDPALVGFLSRKENVPVSTVEHWLNNKSGLLGLSGLSQDTRVLVKLADPRARLALDVFAYRVRKYVGAYVAAMGGAEAIVFGGGIGENTPQVRRSVCEGLECLGLFLDTDANEKIIDREGRISREDSRMHAFVIPTEEGLMMAREVLNSRKTGR